MPTRWSVRGALHLNMVLSTGFASHFACPYIISPVLIPRYPLLEHPARSSVSKILGARSFPHINAGVCWPFPELHVLILMIPAHHDAPQHRQSDISCISTFCTPTNDAIYLNYPPTPPISGEVRPPNASLQMHHTCPTIVAHSGGVVITSAAHSCPSSPGRSSAERSFGT